MDNESFVAGYIACALWTSQHGDGYNDDSSLSDLGYCAEDLSSEAYEQIKQECNDFIANNAWLMLDLDAGQCGHDFWLTRNGHGAGFWDRDLGERGDTLTAASKVYGESYLYLGDDDNIHV